MEPLGGGDIPDNLTHEWMSQPRQVFTVALAR